jgi:hypothetical protein
MLQDLGAMRRCSSSALPHGEGGQIVSTASIAGLIGFAYGALRR